MVYTRVLIQAEIRDFKKCYILNCNFYLSCAENCFTILFIFKLINLVQRFKSIGLDDLPLLFFDKHLDIIRN